MALWEKQKFKWPAINLLWKKSGKKLLNYFTIIWLREVVCIYSLSNSFNIEPCRSPYWVSFLLWSNICSCCWNRSVWIRRRSCPKTWARQPPSSSSFSKPLRSSWPKRETQWEHYRSTWKERWDSSCGRTTLNTRLNSLRFFLSILTLYLCFEGRVRGAEGRNVRLRGSSPQTLQKNCQICLMITIVMHSKTISFLYCSRLHLLQL